jgi:hypothetical protein
VRDAAEEVGMVPKEIDAAEKTCNPTGEKHAMLRCGTT